MIKKICALISAVILTFLFLPSRVLAQEEINKFGIHILDTEEVSQAASLVNSQGGDWGFLTIVLRINDLDQKKWQKFFDNCRRLHLVPLIRLATENENEAWRKPTQSDIDQLAEFLANLNWPVKNQYIIVFNETNHSEEWGGEINPAEYAQLLSYTQKTFKAKNKNFQILNGGFDLAAGNTATTMDAYSYWQAMVKEAPEVFNQLDAWSSHSYPNPGFLGKPTDQGRTSITGYRWEIATLKTNFALNRELPVFITETGWPHGQTANGRSANGSFYTPEKVAEYIEEAFKIWLADPKIVAVTPFVLNYHVFPLDVFSWLDQEGNDYPHTQMVRNMTKIPWQPEQTSALKIEKIDWPKFLPINSSYQGKITLKNIGQSIWGEQELTFMSLAEGVDNLTLPPGIMVEPGEDYQFSFKIQAPEWPKNSSFSWEKIDQEFIISFFNPSRISSYKSNFWQKIIALIRVWWYEKIPKGNAYYSRSKND